VGVALLLMAFALASYRDIATVATMQVKIQHCAPSFWSYTWGKMHMANNEMHHAKMKAGLIQRNPGVDWAPQKVALVKLHGRPAAMDVDDDSRRHGPTDDRRHGPTDDSSRRHGPTGMTLRPHWSQRLRYHLAARGGAQIVLTSAGFQTLKYSFQRVPLARSLAMWRDHNVTDQLMQSTLAACGWPMARVFNCLSFHDPARETEHLGSHATNLRGMLRLPRERKELIDIMTRVALSIVGAAVFMELVPLPNHHQF
jgi:hypothetical protein